MTNANAARILIVEDDPRIARAMKRTLQRITEIDPVVAHSLELGSLCVRGRFPDNGGHFDLVLTDRDLGDGLGDDIVRLCLDRRIPVVMYTATPNDASRWVRGLVPVFSKMDLTHVATEIARMLEETKR